MLAEDCMNALTEIIELRSSCQMVWKTLNQIEEEKKKDKYALNFSLLDTTTYFMSKCISLVEILHDLLKEKDIQVYEKVKARVCEELKWSMERAID